MMTETLIETPSETPEIRLKRLAMRSWRRGTKEMDLILGSFADTAMADLNAAQIDLYDTLLDEGDHDLYSWFTGLVATPDPYSDLVDHICESQAFLRR